MGTGTGFHLSSIGFPLVITIPSLVHMHLSSTPGAMADVTTQHTVTSLSLSNGFRI
jgi:hypothetical protein